jgi:8-oxo-dGTP pyrophosphatase MutT (NUDIX family)
MLTGDAMTDPSHCLRQAAALAVRDGRVCLVTSSSGRRWILPKGMIEPGQTEAEAAVSEAWEEAGVAGEVLREPLGTYRTAKWGQTCVVVVYGIAVGEAAERWPEADRRQRRWVSPERAAARLDIPALQEILRSAFAEGGAFYQELAADERR